MATANKQKPKLTESQQASLTMLLAMGKTERQALEFIGKTEMERAREKVEQKRQKELRALSANSGKRTIKMTESDQVSFLALRAMGRSEKAALEFIERDRGHKFTDQSERVTFANLSFKPLRRAK